MSFNVFKATVAPSSGRNSPAISGTPDTGGGQGNLNQRLADWRIPCLDSRPTYTVFPCTCPHFLLVRTPAVVVYVVVCVPVSGSHYLAHVSSVFLGSGPALTALLLLSFIHVSLTCVFVCGSHCLSPVPRPCIYWTLIFTGFLFWICLPWIHLPSDSKSPQKGFRFCQLTYFIFILFLVPVPK